MSLKIECWVVKWNLKLRSVEVYYAGCSGVRVLSELSLFVLKINFIEASFKNNNNQWRLRFEKMPICHSIYSPSNFKFVDGGFFDALPEHFFPGFFLENLIADIKNEKRGSRFEGKVEEGKFHCSFIDFSSAKNICSTGISKSFVNG